MPSICAYFQMPGKSIVYDKMEDELAWAWHEVTPDDIASQIQNEKVKWQKSRFQ